MYLYEDLKPTRFNEKGSVMCPVKGCDEKVQRQHKGDRFEKSCFLCPRHPIYISPSTFGYVDERNNYLWNDDEDISLLSKIKLVKRESRRLGRENSEDAVTWNVFRYLEKTHLLEPYLNKVYGREQIISDVIYWTYSRSEGGVWLPLKEVWDEFERYTPRHRTEPDLIIKTENALFVIEAKLNSGNDTKPNDLNVKEKYLASGWFNDVFRDSFSDIAVGARKYELMRMYLLGSRIANKLGLKFHLINLVPEKKETDIEEKFGKFMRPSDSCFFSRKTWEEIYQFVKSDGGSAEKAMMLKYFEGKTAGYLGNKLQKAFNT